MLYMYVLSGHYYHRHYHRKSFLAMEGLYLVQLKKSSVSHYQANYERASPELPRDSPARWDCPLLGVGLKKAWTGEVWRSGCKGKTSIRNFIQTLNKLTRCLHIEVKHFWVVGHAKLVHCTDPHIVNGLLLKVSGKQMCFNQFHPWHEIVDLSVCEPVEVNGCVGGLEESNRLGLEGTGMTVSSHRELTAGSEKFLAVELVWKEIIEK